jgi:hypothetical protein
MKKNDFIIDETIQNDNIQQIIGQFIQIIVNIIVYKGKKDKNSILTTYQLYVYIFKNNLSHNYKNKLNSMYHNYKEFAVNNIINNHFIAINVFINNLIHNLEHNTIWV